MRPTHGHRISNTGWLAILTGLLVLAPSAAGAFQILGRVVNGTTGTPVSPAVIKVVNPSGGMVAEKEVKTIDDLGHFTVDDLSESVPVYLLRVTFEGVHYTEIVRFDGRDPVTVEMKVYERTVSWDDIEVSVPHMMIARFLDTLTVDKLIQIANKTSPPRTVHGEGAGFVLYLPPDVIELNGLSVRSLGIPLPMTPVPTDETGFYSIDYPIKPGVTTVQLSIDLPYQNSAYTYTEPMKYDVDELLIITQDPSIEVASTTAEIGPAEDFHGFKSYQLGGLIAGEPLTLTFRGGGAAPGGTAPQVFVIHNRARNLAIGVTIVLILTLIGFLITVVGKGHSRTAEKEVLQVQKEELLNQLARLDDLYKTGTVSDQMYKLKRSELMNTLAEIYYGTTFEKDTDSQKKRTKGAASV